LIGFLALGFSYLYHPFYYAILPMKLNLTMVYTLFVYLFCYKKTQNKENGLTFKQTDRFTKKTNAFE
jgi:hypothetical protein